VAAPAVSSPSALNRFLGCEYRTYIDILDRRGELGAERKPPEMQLLFERGERHEQGVVARMRADGLDVVALEDEDATKEERAERTLAAMREGRQVLHQGCFLHDGWVGYPDFLIRVEEPSRLGAWSYEVADAKLGRTPRPQHIFQLLFYNEQLERVQGRPPARMRLILGDGSDPRFRAEDFDAYADEIREMFVARSGALAGPSPDPAAAYPYPVGDCAFCHWWHVCADKRRAEDHVSLVANLRRGQGLLLEAHGVHSLSELVTLPAEAQVPRLAAATVSALRAQADLQLRSRHRPSPLFELLEPGAQAGLARLPEPSAGDVHFDFEGDPYWAEEGLEFLFGTVYEHDGIAVYWPLWARSRAEEKVAFQTWVDWITARLQTYPDLHVFHYNSYETVALKKLVGRHATREHEVDELLRRKVFVDLYGITRQAVRAGVESYGLKGMEPVFGFERNAELRGAVGSMRRWQAYQDDGDQEHLDAIALYNEDDCLSTRALYDWLLDRRPEAEAQWGVTIDALRPESPTPPGDKTIAYLERLDGLRPLLTGDLPDDEAEDDPEQRARRMTFDLLGYHRREDKPMWWAFFDRREKSAAQLRHEDRDAIGELTVLDGPKAVNKSWQWTLAFPDQEHKLSAGSVDDPDADGSGTIVSVDEDARTLVYARARIAGADAPTRLAPSGPYNSDLQVQALLRFGDRVATHGIEPCGELDAGTDLLLRRAPRFGPVTPALTEEPSDLQRLCAQVRGLDASALVVQGPPGTGKTYTGARIAVDLLARGKRVGVMATSHKAINNLLRAIDEAADEAGVSFHGWKKGKDADHCYESDRISFGPKPPSEEDGAAVTLIGATAWHWAHGDRRADVETLLIDEAGQVSLADAIAVSQAARNVVLLGDPQQLAHVSQGSHPRRAGASVLEHLLDGAQTIPSDRGVLLRTSWRMHPAVCSFISDTMYDGRLRSQAGCDVQRIDSPGLSGNGLRLLACEHDDNRGRSIEEADLVAVEVAKLLDGGTYISRETGPRRLTLEDILVVAPYNAQVRCLRSALPAGARVGTVDKFQGQQAPVVLFSMTSSSGDDASRGMSFLFSRTRLNVAVSRAQALAVIVCSPKLLTARCSTVEDMRLVNMLCRFARAANGSAPAA
jgi:predicted RecB family nuclease